MTTTKSHAELRRWSNLSAIRLAIQATIPGRCDDQIGLLEIAELCRRHVASHQGGDWNDMRDLIIMIAVEWDLTNDSLDAQTDACLCCVANLLRLGAQRNGNWVRSTGQSSRR